MPQTGASAQTESPMDHPVVAPPKLTPRERQIVKLVQEGYTNQEMAHELGISVRTVEVHRYNLMRALKVRNVVELIRAALKHGLVQY